MNTRDIKATWKGGYTRLLKRHFGPFKSRRAWLAKTQYLGAEELKEIQLGLLTRMVEHAYKTVPYYKAMMTERDIRPENIKGLDDIKRFPIMSKADLKEAGDSLISTKFNPRFMIICHTGGTSGSPMPLKRNLRSIQNEHAFVRRQFDWAGITMKDRCAYLTWRRIVSANQRDPRLYVYDAMMRELILSTIHLSEDTIEIFADAMKKYSVKALIAYPSAAYVLARGCLAKDISLPLKAVLTTSETLDDAKGEVISTAFGCKVFDFYGNAERICYIHTCEHGSYHILPEYGLTELLPAGPPNDDCSRIVATSFWNMAMPLIRYDIGDLVEPLEGGCPCGRAFPMVKRILGRGSNIIKTPSGRILGAMAVEYMLDRVLFRIYKMPILEAQIIYEPTDNIVLEYAPMANFTGEDANKLRNLLRREIPEEIKVDIRRVEKLNRTAAGKCLSFVMAEHH